MVSLEDPRYRTKVYIEAYDTPANLTKDDDSTQVTVINQFERPPYPIKRVYFDLKNVDAIRTIYTATTTPHLDWRHYAYAYTEQVPIELSCVTKQGITGDKLRWKLEEDLRNSVEDYPLGSVRLLRDMAPQVRDMGTWKLHTVRYTLSYKRPVYDYTSDVAISYGVGHYDDGYTLGSALTGTATNAGADPDAQIKDTTNLTQVDDYWNGAIAQMLSGDNAGEQQPITDFDDASDSLTVGHNFSHNVAVGDAYRITAKGLVEDGNTAYVRPWEYPGEMFIWVTVSAGNKDCYVSLPAENSVSNISISTNTYTKARWRYKTDSNTKAKIVAVFSDASTQTLLTDTASSTYAVGSTTLTASKTLDHIRLHATTGTGAVWYDYIVIYKDDFTFPNVVDAPFEPTSRNARPAVPSRVVDPTQNLGAEPSIIELVCDLDMEQYHAVDNASGDSWTRSGDANAGDVFSDILHEQTGTCPFQYLDWGDRGMRVAIDSLRYEPADGLLHIRCHEYSAKDMTDEYWYERWNT